MVAIAIAVVSICITVNSIHIRNKKVEVLKELIEKGYNIGDIRL